MVDVRVDNLVAELTFNAVPVQVIRVTEQKEWAEEDADPEKYPGLQVYRAMRKLIEAHGEDKFLHMLDEKFLELEDSDDEDTDSEDV